MAISYTSHESWRNMKSGNNRNLERHIMEDTSGVGLSFEKIDYNNAYDFTIAHRPWYFEFLLFENGNGGRQSIDFVEYRVKPKTLYVIAPGQVHLLQRKSNENGVLLQVSPDFLAQCIHPYNADWNYHLRSFPEVVLSDKSFCKMKSSFNHLRDLLKDGGHLAQYKLKHVFALIFLEILDITLEQLPIQVVSDSTLAFIKYAEGNFDKHRNISRYAKELGIPPKKLACEVKARFGKTPLQIVHELLYLEIKRVLRTEQMSFKEVSHQLNFDDQSSFTRFVRKQGGMTPTHLKLSLMK